MVVETSSSATSRRGKQRKYFEQSAGARGHRYTLGKFRLLDMETRGPMSRPVLPNVEELVRLEGKPPLRMGQAIVQRGLSVGLDVWAVHWLEHERFKIQSRKTLRPRQFLRIDQLEFVSVSERQFGAGLWAHADPIKSAGGWLRAVRFDGNLNPHGMERVDRRLVELQQRLASSADDKRPDRSR